MPGCNRPWPGYGRGNRIPDGPATPAQRESALQWAAGDRALFSDPPPDAAIHIRSNADRFIAVCGAWTDSTSIDTAVGATCPRCIGGLHV